MSDFDYAGFFANCTSLVVVAAASTIVFTAVVTAIQGWLGLILASFASYGAAITANVVTRHTISVTGSLFGSISRAGNDLVTLHKASVARAKREIVQNAFAANVHAI